MTATEAHLILEGSDDVSLTNRAYREIEEQIVTLRLPPGQVLSEAGLSKYLDIGRTPVREALQQLSREGLVAIFPRRGVIVSEINIRNQLELLRVRREVERLMARLAAERASKQEVADFASIAAAISDSANDSDALGFMRLDRDLNLLVANACRNDYACRAMGLMQGLSRRFWYLHYREVLDLPKCAEVHAGLAAAIAAKDKEAAAAASDLLIDYIESFTRSSLDSAAWPASA
jgi:DNA-binding GntR family transcriptional regulator